MTGEHADGKALAEPVDYEKLVDMFNRALIHTLRKHSVADSFLDFWVPDADPVLGVTGMVDSARIVGLASIAVRFRLATVPAARLRELEQALTRICTPALTIEGTSVLLHATGMKQAASAAAARSDSRRKRAYWEADVAGAPQPDDSAPAGWDDAGFPEYSDVHPHFRARLAAESATLSHAGSAGQPSADLVEVIGREQAVALTLFVDPETHRVCAARHTGATKQSERVILDLFCRAAEGLPIQEVADHTGLKVLDSLVDEDKAPPVGGVLLPINAGAPFMLPPRLARRAYDAYRARTGTQQGTNFYYAPPAAEWQDLSADQRREKVEYTLRAFLQSEGLYPDDMNLLRIAKNKYSHEVRVIVAFSDRVPVADKPNLMRRLEQRLRRHVEPGIDLVADRAKDTSPLRRLS